MEIIFLLGAIFIFGLVNGIISFIRLFKKPNSTPQHISRQDFLIQVIADLDIELKQYPNETHLQNLALRYKNELEKLTPIAYIANTSQETTAFIPSPIPKPQESFFENWYKENSINFLLYLGAFFIVLACVIFLSFTWDTLSGQTRFLSFSFFTVCFGIAGIFLYRLEKVAQAGVAFLGITALLIPLNGAAYQRFVLQTNDTNSTIWFATSFISLLTYSILFKMVQNRFYAVLLNIASLSLVESFLSFFKPETENYIFGAIVTSFILFAANFFLKNSMEKDVQKTFDGTSQLILILSLIYGFITLSAKGDIFIWQAAFALILSGVYFLIRYMIEKNQSLIISILFFGLSTFFTAKFLDASVFITSLSLIIFAFGCLALSYIFVAQKKESLWFGKASIIAGAIGHCYFIFMLFGQQTAHKEFTIITFLIILLSVGIYTIFQKKEVLYLIIFYLIIFIWTSNIAYVSIIFPNQETTTLSFLYVAMSTIFAFLYNDEKNTKEPFTVGILVGMALSLGIGYTSIKAQHFTIVTFSNLLLSLFLLKKFKEDGKIYIPIVTFLIFIFSLLKTFNIDIKYLGFVETFATGMLYIFSFIPTEFVTTKAQKNMLLHASLWGIGGFGLLAGISYQQEPIINMTSLLSLVLASILFTHYSFFSKTQQSAGIASFFWVSVILRIFYNAEITNIQFYIQPIAYYVLAWGLFQFKKTLPNADNYILLGLCISIIPLFFQSFGQNHVDNALYLAAEGLVLTGIGIGLQERIFRYGGVLAIILAIFAQTSDYILNLPRWLLVGIVGFVILSIAIYLLRTKTKT